MPVPDFQSFLKPVMDIAADGQEHSVREAREKVALALHLTPEDLGEMLPSGVQTKYDNRVYWAIVYLVQAKALSRPRRGSFQITDRGKGLLQQGHGRIDIGILKQYPEFLEFHTGNKGDKAEASSVSAGTAEATPEEVLQQAYQGIRNQLVQEVLSKVKSCSPKFFENLVVDLMLAMGYGGSRPDAGSSIGRSGDEGIDGIIKEDRLGLDLIYLQAKQWDGTVGRPEIHKFVGALTGKRAKKGVFITSSKFSDEAVSYANGIEPKVILIDGWSLANFMVDLNIGVTTSATFEVKRIDNDYYSDEL